MNFASPVAGDIRSTWKTGALFLVVLMALTCLAYSPGAGNTFIWDDDDYVVENRNLRTFDGLLAIWLHPHSLPQYYPMVHTTFWVEYQLWGAAPLGYHQINIVLHALNAFLIWLLLRRLGVPWAWLAAAIFAVHPVHVESVAWITERKNVLSLFFCLAAALLFLKSVRFGRDEAVRNSHKVLYSLSLICFVLALLSKTVTAVLPAALLVIIWWKHDLRLKRDWPVFLLLAPFLLAGLALGLVTVQLELQHVGAFGADWDYGLVSRILIAGRALWFYLGKLVWPHPLVFFYERWEISPTSLWQHLFPFSFIVVLLVLWFYRNRLGRGPLAALLIYSGALFPALGFFNVFPHRYSFVADHFQYLASIPAIALLVAALARIVTWLGRTRLPSHQVAWLRGMTALCLLAPLVWLTIRQVPVYANEVTLWQDTIAKNPSSWAAHHNLGNHYKRNGQFDQAWRHFEQAIQLRPHHERAYLCLAEILEMQGRWEEAEVHYRIAARYGADDISILLRVGNFFIRRDQPDKAMAFYLGILEREPGNYYANLNAGHVYMLRADFTSAERYYRRAVAADPASEPAGEYLRRAIQAQGRPPSD
ncbi:MAG: tetratricopeptide repeat protein [Acidobacteria bacterium]|nr:tetratricopeptide repeat protein [Acidobacteriota bacterium]